MVIRVESKFCRKQLDNIKRVNMFAWQNTIINVKFRQGRLRNLILLFDTLASSSIEAWRRFVPCTASNKWLHVRVAISWMDFSAAKDTILN